MYQLLVHKPIQNRPPILGDIWENVSKSFQFDSIIKNKNTIQIEVFKANLAAVLFKLIEERNRRAVNQV